MNDVLAKQDFLVGNKVTIADLSFIPCMPFSRLLFASLLLTRHAGNTIAFQVLLPDGVDPKTAYPSLWAWHQKLVEIPYVAEGLAERAAVMAPKA